MAGEKARELRGKEYVVFGEDEAAVQTTQGSSYG